MARALVAGGLRPKDLAEAFGFTPGQVSRILQTPMFQTEVARLEEMADDNAVELRDDIRRMATRAIEVLDEDMEVEPTTLAARNVRQRAALSVIDRFVVKPEPPRLPFAGAIENLQVNVYNMPLEEVQKEVFDLIEEEPDSG
jgi:hypothetical protein